MCPVINNIDLQLDDFFYGKNNRHLLKLEYRDDELGKSSLAQKLLAKKLIQDANTPEEIEEGTREFICNLAQKLASRGGDTQKCCLALVATAACSWREPESGLIKYDGSEHEGISEKLFNRRLRKAYILITKELKRTSYDSPESEVSVSEAADIEKANANTSNYENELLTRGTSELSRYNLEHIKRFWAQSSDISSIEDAVLKIVGDHLGVPGATLSPSNHIVQDLGAEPLDKLELIMTVEELFGIRISGDVANQIERISDIVITIKKTFEETSE